VATRGKSWRWSHRLEPKQCGRKDVREKGGEEKEMRRTEIVKESSLLGDLHPLALDMETAHFIAYLLICCVISFSKCK
jgi:hypothetical protein